MYTIFIKIFHIVEGHWLFPYLASALPQSVTISIWKAHRLDPISINLCANNYQNIPKGSIIMGIFAAHFGISIASFKEKVGFGNSFVLILSILMCIQNLSKYPIYLKTYGLFNIFTCLLRRSLGRKSGN